MIDKFLKEQNIKIGGTWVCEDTKGNVRTVDIKQLLEDYHEWKVKKISSNSMLADSLPLSGKEVGCDHCGKIVCDDDTTT